MDGCGIDPVSLGLLTCGPTVKGLGEGDQPGLIAGLLTDILYLGRGFGLVCVFVENSVSQRLDSNLWGGDLFYNIDLVPKHEYEADI